MEYENNLNKAVNYIESNLSERIKTSDVAYEAAYSLFHFHRIFQAVTGDTINAYIRLRRLTEAARKLLNTQAKIIDISFDTGFESQEAFTRAFKKTFGITPGKYRKDGKHYPTVYKNRLDISSIIQSDGRIRMKPELKDKKGFKIVGLRYYGNNSNNEIPELWQEFMDKSQHIKHLGNPYHFYGVCSSSENDVQDSEDMKFEYIAGRDVIKLEDIPDGMVGKDVPDGKYAVFTHRGSLSNLKDTYAFIYGEWAKSGEYQLSGTLDFEFYNEKFDPAGSEESELYIYVPIK